MGLAGGEVEVAPRQREGQEGRHGKNTHEAEREIGKAVSWIQGLDQVDHLL